MPEPKAAKGSSTSCIEGKSTAWLWPCWPGSKRPALEGSQLTLALLTNSILGGKQGWGFPLLATQWPPAQSTALTLCLRANRSGVSSTPPTWSFPHQGWQLEALMKWDILTAGPKHASLFLVNTAKHIETPPYLPFPSPWCLHYKYIICMMDEDTGEAKMSVPPAQTNCLMAHLEGRNNFVCIKG